MNFNTDEYRLFLRTGIIQTGGSFTPIGNASNGLSVNGIDVILGGSLNEDTNVVGSYTLSLGTSGDKLKALKIYGGNVQILASGATFTDLNAIKTGIQYAANYDTTLNQYSLVDKRYVDVQLSGYTGNTKLIIENLQTQIDNLSQLQSASLYYVEHHSSSDVAGYKELLLAPLTITGVTKTVNLNNNTQTFDSYVTNLGQPNLTGISAGIWVFHAHVQWSADDGNNFLHFVVYKRAAGTGGTETILFSASTSVTGTTLQEYQIEVVQPTFTLLPTDRLVLKIQAQATGGAKTATLEYGGIENFAFIQPPININASPFWSSIQNRPLWLTGTTLGDFEAGHGHDSVQIIADPFQIPVFADPLVCDAIIYKDFKCAPITGNTTINLINAVDGDGGIIELIISGAGGYTIVLGTMFTKNSGGGTIDTTAAADNIIAWMKIGSDIVFSISQLS